MSTLEMKKLKGLLQETVIKLSAAGSVSSGAAIDALRKSDAATIQLASHELEDGMMHRLLSQLATRRPKNHDGQPDMFAGYPGLQQFIGIEVTRDGVHALEYKPIEKATLGELAAWLATERKTSVTRRQRNPGMAKLLRDLSKAAKGSKSITVGAAMALMRGTG